MNFNHMALMRRDDVLPFATRKMLKRGYVSLPVRNVTKRRMQTGRGVLNTVKTALSSQLGKEILAASISSVGENAENGYVKSFGKAFDTSLKKKKTNSGIMLPALNDAKGSSATSSTGLSSRQMLDARGMSDAQFLKLMAQQTGNGMRRRRSGRKKPRNQRGGVHPGLLMAIPAGIALLSNLFK